MSAILILIFFSFCSEKENRTFSKRKLSEVSSFTFPGKIHRYFVDDSITHIFGSPYERILSYTDDGILVKEVGKPGPADWEITSLWWYDENDTSYTMYDYGKNLINRFQSKSDSLVTSYKYVSRSNIIKHGQFHYLTTSLTPKGDFEFSLLDIRDNNTVKKFAVNDLLIEIGVKEFKDLDFLLYGDFTKSNANSNIFIYYCLNAPVFFKIDLGKNEIQAFKDFRYEYMPEIYRTGKRVVLSPNQNWFVSGSVIDDEIYFLTTDNKESYIKQSSQWFLDIYHLKDGTYKESIPMNFSSDERFPFEIRNRADNLIIGFDYEKLKLYEVKK